MPRALIDALEIDARHADHMAAMAQYWMRRAHEAERTAGVLILAAGGKIVVEEGQLQRYNDIVVERENHDYDMTVHFRARVDAPAE